MQTTGKTSPEQWAAALEAAGPAGDAFERIASLYRSRWGIDLQVATPDGQVIPAPLTPDSPQLVSVRRLAIEEALRWGEPAVEPSSEGMIVWAIPLMHNARIFGGLIAAIEEQRVFPDGTMSAALDIRAACNDLRRLAEESNLTNAALLEARRLESNRERLRAEAIHSFKAGSSYDMRAAYLLDEPMLLAAIRKGDRPQGRALLNRVLVGMIHRAGENIELAKSFFMELVVMLTRTAVEAGGEPEELLGANYASIAQLSQIHTDEQLSAWLSEILERIMDSIHRHRKQSAPDMLSRALQFMAENCCRNISRDDAATAAFMSPSHFSRYFKKHLGQSFTEVLNQMRIDRSADTLANTDRDLKVIALEAGFPDQSYFTKVFRRYRGMTPAEFRKQARR
jgi:AraC-like DNA-binding protein